MSLYLLVSETHPLAQHTTVPVSALRNQPMVLLDLPVINDYYHRLFESAKVNQHIACTATSLEIVRSRSHGRWLFYLTYATKNK
jgi:hypothetical protein